MLVTRINRRVSKLSEMISQINQILTSSRFVFERSTFIPNPHFIPSKFQCFCVSRLAQNPETSRVSRSSRNEAQEALFDYLHCTRNLSFTDAEHISKNSPTFVQNLLSEIDTEDISRSLSRFFRYNPINEFEPFLESMGLSPSELPSLLPRHMMFLNDDPVMLENYHVLCGYGIPRSKIGTMYREATEVFGYDSGVMSQKLQAYEKLGLSRPTVIKLVSSCPLLLVGGVNSEFVEVLRKLKGLGIDNDWIGGYISGSTTYNWKRMIDTIYFLEKVGYGEEEMSGLFNTNPSLLLEGSGKRVYTLFGRLIKLGLGMNEVCFVFKQNPKMLSRKCSRNLLKAVDFMFEIGMPIEDTAIIVSKHMDFLGSSSLKGPKTVCRELKVKRDALRHIIMEDPLKVLGSASKSRVKSGELVPSPSPSNNLEKASFLMRLGYVENSEEMTKAWKKFRGRGDQLQERFNCLVGAGLDYNAVSEMVRHAPMILNQTKGVIEAKMDCLTKGLGYPLESVVGFPTYLCYDMDRIKLRFTMYMWLKDKGVAKPMLKLSTILACSDKRFVKYFVDVHGDGPDMWERLKSSSADVS